MTTIDGMFTVPAAARQLGIAPQTLRKWVKRDQIRHVLTPSGRVMFRQADLDAALEVRDAEQ